MAFNTASSARKQLLIAVAITCGSSSSARAGDLRIAPSITTYGYYYSTDIGQNSGENTEAISIQPKLVTVYSGIISSRCIK